MASGDLARRESVRNFRKFVGDNLPPEQAQRVWQLLESIVFVSDPNLAGTKFFETLMGEGPPSSGSYPLDGVGFYIDETADEAYTVLKWQDTFYTVKSGGGGIGAHSHADHTDLDADDHDQYILGDRVEWTDLTDGGDTELHTHSGAGVSDHGDLTGLEGDDHSQYILGDRPDWTDLTDAGETILHTHAGIGGEGYLPLTAGKDYPLTGDLYLTLATTEPPDVDLANGESVFWYDDDGVDYLVLPVYHNWNGEVVGEIPSFGSKPASIPAMLIHGDHPVNWTHCARGPTVAAADGLIIDLGGVLPEGADGFRVLLLHRTQGTGLNWIDVHLNADPADIFGDDYVYWNITENVSPDNRVHARMIGGVVDFNEQYTGHGENRATGNSWRYVLLEQLAAGDTTWSVYNEAGALDYTGSRTYQGGVGTFPVGMRNLCLRSWNASTEVCQIWVGTSDNAWPSLPMTPISNL